MPYACPHCRQPIQLKTDRPGRFAPQCPHCARRFSLIVHDANDARIEIAASIPPTAANAPAPAPAPMPGTEARKVIGGYEIAQQLGKGGMGSVYLARQLSLQREVALKVLKSDWTSEPTFVARFEREARAAAQLSHHNVVQIFDVGRDGPYHYFSMELVRGQSLAKLIKEKGPLDVEVAAEYVLQAARGLHFAHERGLIHRDVKPDNLLLNDLNVIKVADLGLVKSIDTGALEDTLAVTDGGQSDASPEVTTVGHGLGTPAYVAPEQARDARKADKRADVYSLGCTFYALLTGHAPFRGETAMEIMIQHLSQPVRLPAHLPEGIATLIKKMMEKKPEDRYDGLAEVIAELERFSGQRRSVPTNASKEETERLQNLTAKLRAAPIRATRGWAVTFFFGACSLTIVLGLLFSSGTLALVGLLLAVLTPLCFLAMHAAIANDELAHELRTYLLSTRWVDALIVLVGLALLVLGLVLFKLFTLTMLCALTAFVLVVVFQALLEQPYHNRQRGPVQEIEQLLQQLRHRGWAEEDLYRFVAYDAGAEWEYVFEKLFGCNKLRQIWNSTWPRVGDRSIPQRRSWRHALIDWLRERRRRREEKPQPIPAAVEGEMISLGKATQQPLAPMATAPAFAQQSSPPAPAIAAPAPAIPIATPVVREEPKPAPAPEKPPEPPPPPPPAPQIIVVPAPQPLMVEKFPKRKKDDDDDRERFPFLVKLWDTLLGPRLRFLAGCLLLGAFFWWAHQNKLVPTEKFDYKSMLKRDWQGAKPLDSPYLSPEAAKLLSSINVGVAGLVVLLSAFFETRKIAFFFLLGAAVMVFGETFGIPAVKQYKPQWVSLMAGGAVALFGFFFASMTDNR